MGSESIQLNHRLAVKLLELYAAMLLETSLSTQRITERNILEAIPLTTHIIMITIGSLTDRVRPTTVFHRLPVQTVTGTSAHDSKIMKQN